MSRDKAKKNQTIGVTGFIGSGKSLVSRFLALGLSCQHLDADKVARDLMEPGQSGWLAVKGYDPKYILADGRLDRVQLRHDIFADPIVKGRIDSLVHPLVRSELERQMADPVGHRVVVEVPLLFEAGWEALFGRVVLVYAGEDVCLQRVVQRDRVSWAQAEKSYQSQMALVEKIKRADHVIDNSGSWCDTQLQLLHLVDIIMS